MRRKRKPASESEEEYFLGDLEDCHDSDNEILNCIVVEDYFR